MPLSLQIFSLCVVVLYFVIIFALLKKKQFELRYSLLWLLAGLVMLLLVIFPNLLRSATSLLGIEVASNGLFAACIFFIVVILISLTTVISGFANKIKGLAQQIALLEERIRKLEEDQESK